MTFEVFLPESLAKWLRQKIQAGMFHDPAEAAFVAFQDLQELDRHPIVRKQLLQAMIQDAIDDPRPGIPIEKVRADHMAQLRRYARTKPPRPKALPKRGDLKKRTFTYAKTARKLATPGIGSRTPAHTPSR